MNNVTLIGNVCRDFELRKTSNDTSIASNTIAVKRDRKEADGTYASDFFDVYCFGAQADYAIKYLKKGDKVCIAGSVHIRDYTTRNGSKGRAVEVSVNSIENLTPRAEDVEAPQPQPTQAPIANQAPQDDVPQGNNLDSLDLPDDDLPF